MRISVRGGRRPLLALTLGMAALLAGCNGDGDDGGEPAATYRAEIRRTTMGVPHIKAPDWGGAGYGYGYAQAQDDLCTIANSMLTFRGERSRHFGTDATIPFQGTIGQPRNLDADFYHRHVLNDAVMQRLIAAQPDKLKQLVAGFAAGYNRYVREIKAGAEPGAHAACRNEAWVVPISDTDVFRRLYAAHFAAGYSNFVAPIANATPPAAASPATVSTTATAAATKAAARPSGRLQLAMDRLPSFQVGGHDGVGSNMIGFGTAATGDGSPLLFGNPHWYWRGPDRFYQAHLTIPGELDVAGTSFLAVPVIQIGYTDHIAWSHTVSTARRYGLFQLTLVPGDPTSYLRDGVATKMTAREITVQVKQADGSVAPVTRTLYESQHGPIVNLGALNAALDTTAGERERGSLEPLLMTPASRLALVVGKWGAVAAVGMLIAVLSCLSFLPAQSLMRSETLAALFRFGPREGTAFFAPYGWREAEFRSTWDEAWRLDRKPAAAWLWRMLSWFQPRRKVEAGRRMSSIVLLEREA